MASATPSRERDERVARSGFLLVDKPAGPTSHDLVRWVRATLATARVGHCGTLDPAATGLLVLCVGEATKLAEYLSGADKTYRARFVLGRSTTTGDAQGELVAMRDASGGAVTSLARLREMVGEHRLAPPAFSAVHVGGARAHQLARAGELPALAPRAMDLRLVEEESIGSEGREAWVEATLTVSKGTYLRALAEELGRRSALPCHLGSLRRLRCGSQHLRDAVTGLQASELPRRRESGPARWRIDWPAGQRAAGSAGESATAALSRAVVSIRDSSLFPLVLARGEAEEAGRRRLALGQRLALGDPAAIALIRALPDGLAGGAPFLVAPAPDASEPSPAVLATRELASAPEPHERIAPLRVLWPDS